MPNVRIVNLTKRFGSIVAVNGVNLEIKDKEYVSIIGPSGCGKTTLIKCVSGIYEPAEGEVYIDDRLVNELPLEERGIGYVFQEIALFPHMDVLDNIVYGPRVKAWPSERVKRMGEEMLEMIQLTARSKAYPRELSGGARQKTGVARALASGSTLLLLDEPLGSLDAKVRAVLRYELKTLVNDLGLTAIHITHDQEEAMSISDRVAIMKAGRIVEFATPMELYTKPKTIFTANFVGEANFMEGKILDVTPKFSVVDCEGLIVRSLDTTFDEGERVVIAIRPEYINAKRIRKGDEKALSGNVENETFEGSTIRYEIMLSNQKVIAVRLPSARQIPSFNIGDRVALDFPREHIILYPYPKTGLEKELSLD